MKNLLKILFCFFKGVILFLCLIIKFIIVRLVNALSYERDTKGFLTKRKIKRIRRLTKFKMFVWKFTPHFCKFLGVDKYMQSLYKRMNYGM